MSAFWTRSSFLIQKSSGIANEFSQSIILKFWITMKWLLWKVLVLSCGDERKCINPFSLWKRNFLPGIWSENKLSLQSLNYLHGKRNLGLEWLTMQFPISRWLPRDASKLLRSTMGKGEELFKSALQDQRVGPHVKKDELSFEKWEYILTRMMWNQKKR